jgi:MFS transporter, YNFM family, putative membrane transport protein
MAEAGEQGTAEKSKSPLALQVVVFSLVCAAFTTIYITQPVLPVLREEFGVDATTASYTIAAVVMGIALSNLPFGLLSDRYPVRPIILAGGIVVSSCSLLCAVSQSLSLLIAARFIQGLFIPALTTCLAALLARTLPVESLNIVMGSYVSATVAGGLVGRLLGGWIHPPLHWRYAFVSSALLVLVTAWMAFRRLPREENTGSADGGGLSFGQLLARKGFLRIYLVAFGSFFVFSSVFNYLPFYLSGPPFGARTEVITLMYLSYVIGIIMGPLAGKLSNRIGNGPTMALGAIIFGLSIALTLISSMPVIMLSLAGICAGFFAIHASAAGSLNRKLDSSRGRANSLYVLFYYLGGAIGIWLSGQAYSKFGWHGVAGLAVAMLSISLVSGVLETYQERKSRVPLNIGRL